ncbi:MAG: hypothetical protein AB7W16_00110 [Candidatus Obscuribacterales bacterium]
MEKLAIHILGTNLVDRLYNWTGGFKSMTGKIACPAGDSVFLLITSGRSYQVRCAGDLTIEEHPDISFPSYTIAWTDEAKNAGTGNGEITVVHPDAVDLPNVFAVTMGESAVDVARPQPAFSGDEINRDGVSSMLLDILARRYPDGLYHNDTMHCPRGKEGEGDLPEYTNAYFDPKVGGFGSPEEGLWHGHELAHGLPDRRPVIEHELAPHAYHSPGDFNYGDFNEGGAISEGPFCDTLESLLAFTRPGGTDLSAALRDMSFPDLGRGLATVFKITDGDPRRGEGEADMQDVRDFDQLKRTHELTLADIERLATTAAALEIDVQPFYNRRDNAVKGLARLESRLAEGGTHAVDSEDVAAIESVFTETMSVKGELQSLISHHRHYQEILATHQRHEEALPGRARSYRYADGVEPNRIADRYIAYAANPEPVLAESKAAFDEIFTAVRRGDLAAAHQAANRARTFSTGEHFLSALVRKGTLVASV